MPCLLRWWVSSCYYELTRKGWHITSHRIRAHYGGHRSFRLVIGILLVIFVRLCVRDIGFVRHRYTTPQFTPVGVKRDQGR